MTVELDLDLGGITDTGLSLNVRISKAPHILIAGMTGSGKSVFLHRLITQMITAERAGDVGLLLIDPKRAEFSRYRGVPHLAAVPAHDPDYIEYLLGWAVTEMETRFKYMEEKGINDAFDAPFPRLVVVIDELANLILGTPAVEKPLVKIASMGRAAGVHLILATQRPSADVITGLIRANVPTRVCMPVITKMDSRIVLDVPGGETLSTPGDFLLRLPGQREPIRGFTPMLTDAAITAAIARARP